jgi:hypothetical protein
MILIALAFLAAVALLIDRNQGLKREIIELRVNNSELRAELKHAKTGSLDGYRAHHALVQRESLEAPREIVYAVGGIVGLASTFIAWFH